MSTPFRKVAERAVHQGSLISVAVGSFEAPDGSTFQRDIVHHPGAVSIVPVDDDRTVLMVRQYRAAIDAMAAEMQWMHERSEERWAEIERLKAESKVIRAQTDQTLDRIDARLNAIEALL